jgi:hypothetical protein
MVKLPELLKTALLAGLVIVTLGGKVATPTDIFTMLEVVERPRLSVATDVSE